MSAKDAIPIWEKMAAEARRNAEQYNDPVASNTMLRAADLYMQLAHIYDSNLLDHNKSSGSTEPASQPAHWAQESFRDC